jgi:hypothetical protein
VNLLKLLHSAEYTLADVRVHQNLPHSQVSPELERRLDDAEEALMNMIAQIKQDLKS